MKKILVFTIFLNSILLNARIVETIVAVVNSDFITKSDVNKFKKNLKNGGLVDEALLSIVDIKDLLIDDKNLINFLINQKLLDSEVKIQNLNITFERVEKEIRNITNSNQMSREQLKKALLKKNINFSTYQNFIKISLERKALIERLITSKIKISEDDITSYYISHKGAQDSVIFEYKLAHILTLHKNGKIKSKNKIKKVLNLLRQNLAFEDIASKYSEDPNFSEGGLIGKFKAGEMLKEIETSVKTLKPGSYSQIIETKIGYHIVRLLNKKIVESPNLIKEKQKIHLSLTKKEFSKRFKTWLADKRENSFVRIN